MWARELERGSSEKVWCDWSWTLGRVDWPLASVVDLQSGDLTGRRESCPVGGGWGLDTEWRGRPGTCQSWLSQPRRTRELVKEILWSGWTSCLVLRLSWVSGDLAGSQWDCPVGGDQELQDSTGVVWNLTEFELKECFVKVWNLYIFCILEYLNYPTWM